MILTSLTSNDSGIVFAKYENNGVILRMSFIPTTNTEDLPDELRDFCKNVWTIEIVNSFKFGGIQNDTTTAR